jgi:hypothetical protein
MCHSCFRNFKWDGAKRLAPGAATASSNLSLSVSLSHRGVRWWVYWCGGGTVTKHAAAAAAQWLRWASWMTAGKGWGTSSGSYRTLLSLLQPHSTTVLWKMEGEREKERERGPEVSQPSVFVVGDWGERERERDVRRERDKDIRREEN